MRTTLPALAIVALLSIPTLGIAQTQHVTFQDSLTPFAKLEWATLSKFVDIDKASFAAPSQALEFINKTLPEKYPKSDKTPAPDPNSKEFYCIIHLVHWADPDAANKNKQKVDAQNWYVYH